MHRQSAGGCTSTFLLVMFLLCLGSGSPHACEPTEVWTNFGGQFNPSGGWFDWSQNDVDGHYCAKDYGGSVKCWDAGTNTIETVYLYDSEPIQPIRGDLQTWFWDHVMGEYVNVLGDEVWAFQYMTRTWRQLTERDFTGLAIQRGVATSGSAVSRDHHLAVVVAGGPYDSRQTRIFDLAHRTYTEFSAPLDMPVRSFAQQQFVYVASIKKFLLFGGLNGGTLLNDLWLLDPITWTWTQVAHQNPPTPRYLAQLAYDASDNRVYLTGGSGGDGHIMRLSLATWTWEQLPLPLGTVLMDYPGHRTTGASVVDPLRGWCSTGGALVEGGSWIDDANIWCVRVEASAPRASATFVRRDTTTQGNWQGVYGADGYHIINHAVQTPSYVQVTPAGQLSYTWAASTTDVRALRKVGASDRLATTWYADVTFTIDVTVTDGHTHQLALYSVDWDSTTRGQQVDILDAASGTVLESRSLTGFSPGHYLVWTISGHVRLRLTRTSGDNAVVSGLFFGPG